MKITKYFGCRISCDQIHLPVAGELYKSISAIYQPSQVIFGGPPPTMLLSETDNEKHQEVSKLHEHIIQDIENVVLGKITVWDKELIKLSLAHVYTNTSCTMYDEFQMNPLPRFKEMKWTCVLNYVDDAILDVFATMPEIIVAAKTAFIGEEIEFPGLIKILRPDICIDS